MTNRKKTPNLALNQISIKHPDINTKLVNAKQILISMIDEIIENGDTELKNSTLTSIRDIQHLFVDFFYPSESRSAHHTKGKQLRRVKSFSETSHAHSENSIEDFFLDESHHDDGEITKESLSPRQTERPKTGRRKERRKSERRNRQLSKKLKVDSKSKLSKSPKIEVDKSKGKSPKMEVDKSRGRSPKIEIDKSKGKAKVEDKTKATKSPKMDSEDRDRVKKPRSSKTNNQSLNVPDKTGDEKEDDTTENKLRKIFNVPKREKQLLQSGNTFVAEHFGYDSEVETGFYEITFVDNHLWKEGLNYEYDVMEMHVKKGDKEWVIFRRWKAFQKLDSKLKKKGLLSQSIFMKKPKKIEKAIIKLADYLKEILAKDEIRSSQYVYNFLGPFQVGDSKPDAPVENNT